ncbi:MAG: GIY-YIG nuclease family protein [archaeon]|nr:GIY-YIG nuclease family protein [archaeon]
MKTVYKSTNLENNMYYIGCTYDFKKRIRDHKSKAKTGVKGRFYDAVRQFGFDSFKWETILYCEDYDADYYEKEIIKLYNSTDENKGYNMALGGAGILGVKRSDETRKKISDSKKGKYTGEKSHLWGKKRSESTRKKISESHKGKRTGNKNPRYRHDISYDEIIYLKNQGLSYRAIGRKLGTSHSVVIKRLKKMECK